MRRASVVDSSFASSLEAASEAASGTASLEAALDATELDAAPPQAARLRQRFPKSLDGERLLLPGKDAALRRALPRWLERQGIAMRIVGEFEESALLKAFGEGGAGVFPTALASLPDVVAHYRVEQVGVIEEIRERFFLISPERRLTHPAASVVRENARSALSGA